LAKTTEPVLIIHGGTRGGFPKKNMESVFRDQIKLIAKEAYKILAKGGTATEAVVHATELLEDHPIFNAGRGSKIQADGKIRLSAALMDGEKLRFSGVVNIQGLKNPIALAERLNDKDCRTLAGKGAAKKAREWGLKFRSPFTPGRLEEFEMAKKGKTGTVGAVALDSKGRIAAATSTGGRGMEWPGRVSDSPTVAGNYANKFVGLSATGVGEQIVDFALCAKVATRVEDGMALKAAMEKSFREARKRKFQFGAIALCADGSYSAITTTPFMLWAVHTKEELKVSL
jgi:L-asparaginase